MEELLELEAKGGVDLRKSRNVVCQCTRSPLRSMYPYPCKYISVSRGYMETAELSAERRDNATPLGNTTPQHSHNSSKSNTYVEQVHRQRHSQSRSHRLTDCMSACDPFIVWFLSRHRGVKAALTGATHESHVTMYEKLAKCRWSELWPPHYVYRLRTEPWPPHPYSNWERMPVGNFDNSINAPGASGGARSTRRLTDQVTLSWPLIGG